MKLTISCCQLQIHHMKEARCSQIAFSAAATVGGKHMITLSDAYGAFTSHRTVEQLLCNYGNSAWFSSPLQLPAMILGPDNITPEAALVKRH